MRTFEEIHIDLGRLYSATSRAVNRARVESDLEALSFSAELRSIAELVKKAELVTPQIQPLMHDALGVIAFRHLEKHVSRPKLEQFKQAAIASEEVLALANECRELSAKGKFAEASGALERSFNILRERVGIKESDLAIDENRNPTPSGITKSPFRFLSHLWNLRSQSSFFKKEGAIASRWSEIARSHNNDFARYRTELEKLLNLSIKQLGPLAQTTLKIKQALQDMENQAYLEAFLHRKFQAE